MYALGVGAIVVCCSCYREYHVGSLLVRLADQQWATEQLLDHISDGFCSISVKDGTLCSASISCLSLLQFASSPGAALGVRFEDLVATEEDRHRVRSLYSAVESKEKPQPALVTCRVPIWGPVHEFDVRLVPYATSAEDLAICFQILGEVRCLEAEAPAGGQGSGHPVPAPQRQPQPQPQQQEAQPQPQEHCPLECAEVESRCYSESHWSETSFAVTLSSRARSRMNHLLQPTTADVAVQCVRGFSSRPGHRCPTCGRHSSRRSQAVSALASLSDRRARTLSPTSRKGRLGALLEAKDLPPQSVDGGASSREPSSPSSSSHSSSSPSRPLRLRTNSHRGSESPPPSASAQSQPCCSGPPPLPASAPSTPRSS